MLFTSMAYPSDYGYVEDSLGEDGDPLDAPVLLDEPTWPGCLVRARPIGMFHMRDEAGGDDKILCIPAGDPRKTHIKELEDINEFIGSEIQHFETYKDLEPGKSVEGAHWTGRVEAEETVRQAVQRAKDAGLSTARWRTRRWATRPLPSSRARSGTARPSAGGDPEGRARAGHEGQSAQRRLRPSSTNGKGAAPFPGHGTFGRRRRLSSVRRSG